VTNIPVGVEPDTPRYFKNSSKWRLEALARLFESRDHFFVPTAPATRKVRIPGAIGATVAVASLEGREPK